MDHVLENYKEIITNNYSSAHQAVDIVGQGHRVDDVVSASDGVVEMVVKNVKYTNHNTKGNATYGNYVKVKHPTGKKTLYAHLKYGSVDVAIGDKVSKGQKLGTIGNTGNAYGAHLHFEVKNEDDINLNPNDYLNGKIKLGEEVIAKKENDTIEEAIAKKENDTIEEADIPKENNTIEEAEIPKENENKKADTNEVKEDQNKKTDLNKHIDTIQNNTSKNIKVSNSTKTLYNHHYKGGSIVDALKGINIDSSFSYRTYLAQQNGITNYRGTYNQNVFLLKLLKEGKLKS